MRSSRVEGNLRSANLTVCTALIAGDRRISLGPIKPGLSRTDEWMRDIMQGGNLIPKSELLRQSSNPCLAAQLYGRIAPGGMMEYKTRDGEPTTLYKLVHQEPDWAVNRIASANKEIESLRAQLDRHLFMGESVEKIKAEKEIESLKKEGEESADLWFKCTQNLYKAEQAADDYKRKYQILRDNLSPEEFGELCELWPELKV